jgi:hypothetical protein
MARLSLIRTKHLGRMVGPKGTWPIHLYLHICPYYATDSTKDFRQTRDSIDYEYNPQGSQISCLPLRVAGEACVTTWENKKTRISVDSRCPVQKLCMPFPPMAYADQRGTSPVLQRALPRFRRGALQLPAPNTCETLLALTCGLKATARFATEPN